MAAPKDPYLIPPDQKSKYESQFMRLQPINGLITGEQAKGLFLQSGLQPLVLAKIWELADVDADGRMDVNEFCIALHLIALKLKGVDPPMTLPQSLRILVEPPKFDAFGLSSAAPVPQSIGMGISSLAGVASSVPSTMSAFGAASADISGAVPPGRPPPPRAFDNISSGIASMSTSTVTTMSTTSQQPSQVGGVIMDSAKLQRAGSITSGDYPASMLLTEWAIPQPSKLKYTQMFNTHDRTRTGFLTGPQARNILLQSGLPQATLAQIWNLSDIDADGRLTCEEFVLAMYLIDSVRAGDSIPGVLPLDLIPPSLRRKRSLSGNVPVPQPYVAPVTDLIGAGVEDANASILSKMGLMGSFEDKRRENFEKGQAELDRRRQLLLDQQKREQHERERKEREEMEKRERIRLEQEMRRQQELERQMQRQKELEAEKEDQRKKMLEQREAARREMERQRMLEWENQRKQEIQLQKQKLLETISQLKSRKTNLIIEMEKVNNQYNQVQEQAEEARKKVADAKGDIDKMRVDRDVKLKEINFLKTQMKTLQDRKLIIEEEKLNLSKQLKDANLTNVQGVTDSTQFALQTRQLTINQLKSQLEEAEVERKQKAEDFEISNNQLKELKNLLNVIVTKTKSLQETYDAKREEAMKMKEKHQQQNAPQDYNTGWADNSGWAEQPQSDILYRAVFAFTARNEDELTVEVGDVLSLIPDPTAESGWIKASCAGKEGWVPETYLEQIETEIETTKLSKNGFSETKDAFKPSKDSSFVAPTPKETFTETTPVSSAIITAVASYPWKGTEENYLSFNKGDIITVTEQQDMWWCGELNGKTGWFPKSYVKAQSAAGEELDAQAQPEYYVSLYPFETQEPGDLAFDANELITVVKKNGEWWTGEIGTERFGIFPSNYVREAQPDEVPKPREPTPPKTLMMPTTITTEKKETEQESASGVASVEASPSRSVDSPKLKKSRLKKPEVVKVIASYNATGPEQLNLEKGQLIQVRKKNSSGWWEGEIQVKGRKRQIGWFPASYVKSLNPSVAE